MNKGDFCRVDELPPYATFSFAFNGETRQLGEYDDDVDMFHYHILENPARRGFVRADAHVYYRG